MALQNNPNMFNAGAVVFNSQPEISLEAQLLARRQARQEALDQYYQNLHKNINPAGMRTQDISTGFNQKYADWQKHFMENKQRITNPRTPEDRQIAIQNQQQYQDLLMDVQKSKDPAKDELELGKARMSGKWNPTQSDLDVAHRISLSIYDPNHYKDAAMTQPYTISDMSLNVPEPTVTEQEAFRKSSIGEVKMKPNYDESNPRKIKETGQVAIPFEERYTDEGIKKIGNQAASLIGGKNSPFYVKYEKMLEDPNWAIGAGEQYRQVYGGDGILRTPQEAAKADAIMKAKDAVNRGELVRKDESLSFQRQQTMEAIKQANRKEMLGLRETAKKLGAQTEDLWIDNYIDKVTNEAKTGSKGLFGAGGVGYEIPIDPTIAKAFTRDGKSPDKLVVTEDGKYVPIFYKYAKDGTLLTTKKSGSIIPEVSQTLSVPITKEQFKLAMGGKAGVKQLNKEMSAGQQQSAPPATEGYTRQELIDAGWTNDQINTAVKAKKIKLK